MKKLLGVMCVTLMALSGVLTGCSDPLVYDAVRDAKANTGRVVIRQTWKPLAEAGDPEAQYKLGDLYCCGETPYFDNAEALRWFCRAARQNQTDAMVEVGRLYENERRLKGSGIPLDLSKAWAFYTLAANRGNAEAGSYRQQLETRLTLDELNTARDMAGKWPDLSCAVPVRSVFDNNGKPAAAEKNGEPAKKNFSNDAGKQEAAEGVMPGKPELCPECQKFFDENTINKDDTTPGADNMGADPAPAAPDAAPTSAPAFAPPAGEPVPEPMQPAPDVAPASNEPESQQAPQAPASMQPLRLSPMLAK